jgi:tetrahydromethanopterin S-methyltransferase subunit G
MASEIKNIAIPKETIKEAVLRTVRSRIEEINQKLNDIYTNLRYFEKKYGMKTEEFYKKFLSGALGDDMDFFEWKASTEIYNELKEEKKVLVEAIG